MVIKVLILASWISIVFGSTSSCVNTIQEHNLLTLSETLHQGYEAFCKADVDEDVLAMFPGSSLSDVQIEVWGGNTSHNLLLKDICKIPQLGLDYTKKTLLFVNGFNILSEAELSNFGLTAAKCKKDINMIFVDFAHNDALLYNTAKYNLIKSGFAVYRIIDTLLSNRVFHHNIVLAGHSQGSQIAAIAAKILIKLRGKSFKLPLVIAVDPAITCDPKNQHVNKRIAKQVIVFHGNNGKKFAIKEPCGTIDFYPNGDEGHQPGCSTAACSHMFALAVFIESVCMPDSLVAIKCKDWYSFTQGTCLKHDVVPINLSISISAKGKYFCVTKPKFPCGLAFKGIHKITPPVQYA